jgi:hypothetical protein
LPEALLALLDLKGNLLAAAEAVELLDATTVEEVVRAIGGGDEAEPAPTRAS